MTEKSDAHHGESPGPARCEVRERTDRPKQNGGDQDASPPATQPVSPHHPTAQPCSRQPADVGAEIGHPKKRTRHFEVETANFLEITRQPEEVKEPYGIGAR